MPSGVHIRIELEKWPLACFRSRQSGEIWGSYAPPNLRLNELQSLKMNCGRVEMRKITSKNILCFLDPLRPPPLELKIAQKKYSKNRLKRLHPSSDRKWIWCHHGILSYLGILSYDDVIVEIQILSWDLILRKCCGVMISSGQQKMRKPGTELCGPRCQAHILLKKLDPEMKNAKHRA